MVSTGGRVDDLAVSYCLPHLRGMRDIRSDTPGNCRQLAKESVHDHCHSVG